MSDPATTDSADRHRRKRVRKGTRSCWECKRRKIRCTFASELDTTCIGCSDRATACISQEYEDVAHNAVSNGSQLGQRMERVEQLLEKFIEKVGKEKDSRGELYSPDAIENSIVDVLTPQLSNASADCPGNAPILSLFNNEIFGRGSSKTQCETPATSSGHSDSEAASPDSFAPNSKLERLRQKLLALVPSQKIVDVIANESNGWWMIKRHVLLELDKDSTSVDSELSLNAVSGRGVHPTKIARLLLSLATCLQQLPSDYNYKAVGFNVPPRQLSELYSGTISAHVTSDDELLGSYDGLVCLATQGVYNLLAGNIRRSWLSFRKALTVAQLMGLHRNVSKVPKDGQETLCQRRGKYLWYQIVKYDCWLALMLGVPSGIKPDTSFVPWDAETRLPASDLYTSKICSIACMILDRNENDNDRAFSQTQDIDDKLEKLRKSMPADWWIIPSASANIPFDKASENFDRVACQMWHFELELLLHLPFMLRATTEPRYAYSKISCLNSSRELVKRWQHIRSLVHTEFACKAADFQAFTSCIALLLGLLSPRSHPQSAQEEAQEQADRALIRSSITILENIPRTASGEDSVALKSSEVLRTLESIRLDSPCNPGATLKLQIPYFGTIVITGGSASPCNTTQSTTQLNTPATSISGSEAPPRYVFKDGVVTPDSRSASASYSNANATAFSMPFETCPIDTPPPIPQVEAPFVGFESSQFPMDVDLSGYQGGWFGFDGQTYNPGQPMVYDSLFNTDVEGNWNF